MNTQEKTIAFLLELKEAGYHKVTIGKPEHKNPACKTWMDGPHSLWCWHPSFKGMYSGEDRKVCTIGGWPAIWRIKEKYLKSRCGGNGHQSQYWPDRDSFVEGTYNLTSSEATIKRTVARKWNKAEREEFEKQFLA